METLDNIVEFYRAGLIPDNSDGVCRLLRKSSTIRIGE